MSTRSLTDWLSYIESQHPSEIELGLERGLAVLEKLNLRRPKEKVITVAGTNGKGSTCVMLSQYLTQSGFKVGTYTSPHFLRFNERVVIDGEECSDELLIEAFSAIEELRGETPLTYFEFSTLAALWVFDRLEVDYWVLEVGLGGRLDSVNMIDTDLAVITSIGLDHVDWLGESIEDIGREKAGIARPNKPIISGVVNPPQSIADVASEVGAPIWQKHQEFHFSGDDETWLWEGFDRHFEGLPKPKLPLENAATVIAVLLKLDVPVSIESLTKLFNSAVLVGRFQQVSDHPVLYIDVAHNPEAAVLLKRQIERLSGPAIAVCGMLKDKDIASVMEILQDSFTDWYLIDLEVPRGAKASELAGFLPSSHQYNDIDEAVQDAKRAAAQQNATIVVFGSFVTVAQYLSIQS